LQRQQRRQELLVTAEDLVQEPIGIGQNATIYEAIEKILECNISGILVKSKKPAVLSQKDIASTLLSENRNIRKIPVAEKAQELVTVDQFAPISNCAGLMLSKKINMLGVTGAGGLLGILTKHDLVKYYHGNIGDALRLSDIMSVGSFFVQDTTPVYDALCKMMESQVSRLLIKDGKDASVGITTFKNFLNSAMYHSNRYDNDVFSTGFGRTCSMREIMTKNIVTVSVHTALARVAKILIDYRIHGVAVTNNQRIIGFVTEKDIVRQIAKSELQATRYL